MKLSFILHLMFAVSISANIYSQSAGITLKMENASIKDVFQAIEGQTDYRFFYNDDVAEDAKPVNLNAESSRIEDVLASLFSETEISYQILNNKLIVVVPEKNMLQQLAVTGVVKDAETGEPLPGVNVLIEGTLQGAITDGEGRYSIQVPQNAVLVFSYVGYLSEKVTITGQTVVDINLRSDVQSLEEVIVVGYGVQKKESVTGAISGITSEDMERVKASTVSAALAGKLAGVSFRMSDGRPGSGANIQIRNMGRPLYVIDGFQKDEGTFNNLSPNDIESISILKDGSAAVYGSRGSNGVVLVTTKRGKLGSRSSVNVDAYTGWQNWARFPETVGAYEWMAGFADSEMNDNGSTGISREELDKWKAGTDPAYRSFDWYDFIIKPNSPMNSVHINANGGTDRVNYYISGTRLFQNSVLGREFTFERYNINSAVDAKISKNLKVGMQVSGRIETKDNPGVPGTDDYWAPRFALFRNRPTERPYANDNPAYINDIGHNEQNWALFTKEISGYWTQNWRVFQSNFNGEYQLPIKGLSVAGKFSYYLADKVMNGHEYTYQTYRYDAVTDTYNKAFAMNNPWRERGTEKVEEIVTQGQVNYTNTFGLHQVNATFVAERIDRGWTYQWVHTVPSTNVLPLLYFDNMDTYDDQSTEEARIGYVGRLNYNYANKYYIELAGRRDASWKFPPDKRWGNFPSISGGWRISEEGFYKNLTGLVRVLTDLKIRASYGILGDDDIGIGAFDYLPGYNYNTSTNVMDDAVFKGARYRGEPITNVTWFTSRITDIGIDYSLFGGKLQGAIDVFKRGREGLLGDTEVVVPAELGYSLPRENKNEDAILGGDGNIMYYGKKGDVNFTVGANFGYARRRSIYVANQVFNNQWDEYRGSQQDRWAGTYWGYNVIGQFQSYEEINNYTVDNDGRGNRTMIPGDLIYEDLNNDGVINYLDERPIGYARDQNPTVNYGINLSFDWKGIDFKVDFSGGTMYSYNQGWEMRWPYQNGGNLVKAFYEDRWHREDILDINSPWVSGKYPALRFNRGDHSNYNKNSTFWLTNVRYLRMRTIELGYTLPKAWTQKVLIERARFYVNGYNLLSFDNLSKLGVEPEIMDENGLQYPQNKLVNVGINLTF